MSNKYNNAGYVTILGRKNGSSENILNVTCALYDMSAYVDCLRTCLSSENIDYLILEPYKPLKLFQEV